MSDSPPSDPAQGDGLRPESPPPDPAQGDGLRPESPPSDPARQGALRDLEDGVAHLFAAFERGVLNIVGAEGHKRRERAVEAPAVEAPAEEVLTLAGGASAPEARSMGGNSESSAVDAIDAESGGLKPTESRPGSTYDEVLGPIRWRNVILGAIAIVLLGVLYWLVTLVQVVTSADDIDHQGADVIVVLGAAQFDGLPSPALAARLDHALDLWHDGRAEFIVTTGSKRQGDRFTEGFSGFVHLRDAGVPEASIITIIDGADTYQQLTATQAQLVERDLATVLLVSDGYHTHRLRSIADEIGLTAFVSPTEIEATVDDYLRETSAVSVGQLMSYRRLSAWNTVDDEPAADASGG